MRTASFLAVVLVLACPSLAAPAEPPALAKARALYNSANYEGAIDAASVARRQPPWADAAALVIARAHLERYRQSADPAELAAARETLVTVRSSALSARDRVDLIIGFGQALYLGEMFGAAAELFDTALSRSALIDERDRLMLLDWWATALDREAQSRVSAARGPAYERIAARMEEELRQNPASAVGSYWLAVAARGSGDVDRAWDAAIAAWVRSSMARETSDQLRTDLDRLVTQALVPERARSRPPAEQPQAMNAFRAEWDMVKEQWK
jgi:hypothetical protein